MTTLKVTLPPVTTDWLNGGWMMIGRTSTISRVTALMTDPEGVGQDGGVFAFHFPHT